MIQQYLFYTKYPQTFSFWWCKIESVVVTNQNGKPMAKEKRFCLETTMLPDPLKYLDNVAPCTPIFLCCLGLKLCFSADLLIASP